MFTLYVYNSEFDVHWKTFLDSHGEEYLEWNESTPRQDVDFIWRTWTEGLLALTSYRGE